MARITNGMMTDTGKRRIRRSMANRTVAPHLGMSRSPVSGTNLRASRNQTNRAIGEMATGTRRIKNLTDTQRAYISAAHKPNQRIGIKPVNPAKPMFAKKVR